MSDDARDDGTLYLHGSSTLTLDQLNPDPWTITFGANGSKLMFWRDGRCTFEGNADEAAKVFYEHVAKHHFNHVRGP